MTPSPAIDISHLAHHYGPRQAIADLSLSIDRGEIFGFLGPNGGGKTTLFRLLSTLIPLQSGRVSVLSFDLSREQKAVRQRIGVVFQAPSLDKKLTVAENIRHQGHLYGLSGRELKSRQDEMLSRLGLTDRAAERCETLSGGLRRRVELAKGMLHRPQLLLLDEPSTGLDPGARADLWSYLSEIRQRDGVTVVLTTHLLEEADRADRLAILHAGSLVALGTPAELRATVGGDSITIVTADPAALAAAIRQRFSCEVSVLGGSVRLEQPAGHEWIARLVEAFGPQIESVTLGKPTLEDVFIDRTGHRFWTEPAAAGAEWSGAAPQPLAGFFARAAGGYDQGMDGAPNRGRQLGFFLRISPATWGTILLAVAAFHLNWIWQRHALLIEEETVHRTVGNYACGMTEETLPPIGDSASQFILDALGEPRIKSIIVFYFIDGSEEQGVKPAEEFPKIERARLLFPEAEIEACWVDQAEIDSEMSSRRIDLRAMISD